MKYPEYRISMEAALPSSVHAWLKCELEQRGIDSLIYTRYIISLLLQNEDFDCEADIFCPSKSALNRKERKLEKKKFSISDEERKKTAAIECLSDLSDEKSDIKSLIDELCARLKDNEAQATVSPVVRAQGSGSDSSEDSGTENQNSTERYYAAFPSLYGKASPSSSPSSVSSVAVDTVWKNNPLVKPVSSALNSADDGSSSNDDQEVKKINKCSSVAYVKPKRIRKNRSRNKDGSDHRKGRSGSKSKHHGHQSSKHEKTKKESKMMPWPPGFAKLDPLLQTYYDFFDDDNPLEDEMLRTETPKRPNEDLCTRVESILKGMLLPTPEKTYKELQDVESDIPDDLKQKSIAAEQGCRSSKLSVTVPTTEQTAEDFIPETEPETVPREASVSPELQEQEIWYTQPIGEIFQSPDEEPSCSKLRLYKRTSSPLFTPDGKTAVTDCVDSSASSPGFDRSRSYSVSSNDSESILEGSVYMPSWLTEEILADQDEEMSIEKQQAYLSTSFNASSPLGDDLEADSQFAKSLEATLTTEDMGWGEATCSISSTAPALTLETDLYNPWSINSDENLTPTPEEAKSLESDHCSISGPLSVSLVDWDYMSQFLGESDWAAVSVEESLRKSHAQRTCLSSLSPNQAVYDFSLDVQDYARSPLSNFGIYWWQPCWNVENALSQLWDVNMQKRAKVSPWGCPSFLPVSQCWVTENTFVFHNGATSDQDSNEEYKENENTLIPRISIDLQAESSLEYMDKNEEEIDPLRAYFDRSISLVDVPSVWEKSTKGPNPKLSKSFELVPSETSAFNDVPRRLIHVHSEPNLVQFRQEFNEGCKSKQHSPQEHLYFSPKTHFRPITPAFAPELSTSKVKQQVCHDLFGGPPTTKTPYQQFVNLEDASDEEFIPKFKLKHLGKSIQTGDAGEKVDSPTHCSDTGDRDTPQALTLEMIEDMVGEKDDADCLFPTSEDLDAANTDSAYETDYGVPAFESEQEETVRQHHGQCSYNVNGNIGDQVKTTAVDHGNLGDRINYPIESFMATFPHTQDWPDISQSCHLGHSQWSDKDDGPIQMASSWPQPHLHPDQSADSHHKDSQDLYLMDNHDSWMSDLFSEHQYNDGEADLYRNIWASGDQDSGGIDMYPFDMSSFNDEFEGHLNCGDSSPQTVFVAEDINCECCDGEIHPTCVSVHCSEQTDMETDLKPLPDVGMGVDTIEVTVNSDDVEFINPGDYFSVQLVYKDKQSVQDPDHSKSQKSYGNFDLMPMPGEGVLSTELEKEWMDPNAVLYRASCFQRKPCSFYLEGNCRRADCKFSHDISNITCRFWEEGDCFKGPLCPFLHGYPRVTSPTSAVPVPGSDNKERFRLKTEEFPELTLTLKNGNTSSKKVGKSIKGGSSSSATRRDRSRKSSSRRYSNKENKLESSRLMEKCSSSV